MNDIIKKVKSFEDAGLLIKVVPKIVENEVKQQKDDFQVCWLLHGCQFLRKYVGSKGVIRACEGAIRAGQIFNATSFLK